MGIMLKEKPDQKIGPSYLERWYLIPKNPIFNIYVHRFLGSDMDRGLHDHPWVSVSFLLKGELIEILEESDVHYALRKILRFKPYFRRAIHKHRMLLIGDEAWTLFITGPKIREWGFYLKDGWTHWEEVVGKEAVH